jgi:hypothetical protein
VSKKDKEGNKIAKGGISTKVKKPPVHLHVGKPAPHFFNKMTRATCDWAPKMESAIIHDDKQRSHK